MFSTYYYSFNPQHLAAAFGLANVIATCFTIFIVVVNVIVYRLNNYVEEKNTASTSPAEKQCERFSLVEMRSATQDFSEGLVVGRGGFGKVYKGFIKNREEVVAVKRLSSGSKQGEDEFWMEIETLSRLRHLHLVSLIGYCNEGMERILVYEYMPRGTLVDHLYKTKGAHHTPLHWETRLKICIGAARGLDYLHTGTTPGVIHRDVKDSNILLDETLVAKIADFGLAKLENIDQLQSHVSTNVKGTFGYMDPEYFLTRRVSKKTDVYAFGVVLLVVLSGRAAVDMRVEDDQQSLVLWGKKCIEEGRVDQIIDPYLNLGIQSNLSLEEFIEAVKNCLQKQPKERPSMAQVVAKLELALEHQHGALSSTMPLELNHNAKEGDIMYHEAPTSSSSGDLSITMPRRVVSLSPLHERSEQGGEKDASSPKLNRSKNELIVCSDEHAKISRSPSLELTIRIFSFAELVVATNNFRDDFKIGEGGTGKCYKGWLAEPRGRESLVSLKRQRPESDLSLEDLQNQMLLIKTFSHPNLLNLMGYCCENDEFLFVQEFMRNSSLDKHLFFQRDSLVLPLPWGLRLKICSDVARGLAFMNSLERPIIHRNLTTSKILLDEFYNAKVCGFGLARFGPSGTESTHVSTEINGTIGYADPEYLATEHLSLKSDVYSFGVILVEMLTGIRAFDRERPTGEQYLIDKIHCYFSNKRTLRRLIDPCLEGHYSMEAAVQVSKLALKYLSSQQKMRPSMREVLQTLRTHSIQQPEDIGVYDQCHIYSSCY